MPYGLVALTIALQIAYPLVEGVARQRLTITTVLAFVLASVSHAYLHRGAAFARRLVVAAGGIGLLVEAVGVRTGVPFGRYVYTGDLGPTALDVPIIIPLAWIMMAYPAATIGRRIAGATPRGVLVAALALAAWDLFLDPQMVAAGYWEWSQSGPTLAGIPLTNHLGWLAAAALIQWVVLHPSSDTPMGPASDDRVPIALYVWTWIGSIAAHAAYLDMPFVAITGGIGMGLVVLGLTRSRST